MSTRIRDFFANNGRITLFIHRDKIGGKIESVVHVKDVSTTYEIRIPLDQIRDDESLEKHITNIQERGGVERN